MAARTCGPFGGCQACKPRGQPPFDAPGSPTGPAASHGLRWLATALWLLELAPGGGQRGDAPSAPHHGQQAAASTKRRQAARSPRRFAPGLTLALTLVPKVSGALWERRALG